MHKISALLEKFSFGKCISRDPLSSGISCLDSRHHYVWHGFVFSLFLNTTQEWRAITIVVRNMNGKVSVKESYLTCVIGETELMRHLLSMVSFFFAVAFLTVTGGETTRLVFFLLACRQQSRETHHHQKGKISSRQIEC